MKNNPTPSSLPPLAPLVPKHEPRRFSSSFLAHGHDLGYIVVGAFLQALAYSMFIAPAEIVPGGVYGITIVLNHVTKGLFSFAPEGLPIGITALFFNVPLLLLATKKLGLSSGPKTALTFVLISIFTDTFFYFSGGRSLVPQDKLLSVFYGGVILALGVYCVFKAGSTSAGTDVLARVLTKGSNRRLSSMIIVIDSAIVLLGLLAFKDWSVPLYSWLTILIYGKVVEFLQPENPNKACFVVSSKTAEIRDFMIQEMRIRGTLLRGKGMFAGEEREVIFTIIERKRLPKIKAGIRKIDPNAFISTMDASNDYVTPLPVA